MSVEATFTVCVCGLCLTGIVGSNSAGGTDVSLLWALCVVSWRSLHRADHSSREVLPNVVCKCDRKALKVRKSWPTRGYRTIKYVPGISMMISRGFWIIAHYIQLSKNNLHTNGILQWWKSFWAQESNQEKKNILRLRYKHTCNFYLVVISDNIFCVLSQTVSDNISGMEQAKAFITEALREKCVVKYLL